VFFRFNALGWVVLKPVGMPEFGFGAEGFVNRGF
jgi:hypothetical protein